LIRNSLFFWQVFMQRHMQNISFLVIVSVLLSCAFFFSEQTREVDDPAGEKPTAIPTIETRDDLPDCSAAMGDESRYNCYGEAAALSSRLVENLSEQILSQEKDSAGRMAFLEMQQAWEDSREADCRFVQDQAKSGAQEQAELDRCLVELNLARFDQLEAYFCDYYDAAACEASAQPVP
jgi:uncharacterized protein YecT (DUF1311 family)